jgi:uncharacterized protein involved in exopolysaccharide biosynthesis
MGWAAYVMGLATVGLLFATFYPPKYEARASLLFPRPATASEMTQRATIGELRNPTLGARLLAGSLLLPTVGADPFSVQGVFRSKRCLEIGAEVLFADGYDDLDLMRIDDALDMEVTDSGTLAVRFRWKGREKTGRAFDAMVRYVQQESRRLSREFAKDAADFLRKATEQERAKVDVLSSRLMESVAGEGEEGLAALAGKEAVLRLLQAEDALRALQIESAGAKGGLEEAIRGIVLASSEDGEAFSEAARVLQLRVIEARRRLLAAGDLVVGSTPETDQLGIEFRSAQRAYLNELERVERAAQDRSLAATLDQSVVVASLEEQIRVARQQVQQMATRAVEAAQLGIEQRVLLGDLRIQEQALAVVQNQWLLARLAVEKSYEPFELLDEPYVSDVPYFPRRGVFTASAAGAGLLLAILIHLMAVSRREAEVVDSSEAIPRP